MTHGIRIRVSPGFLDRGSPTKEMMRSYKDADTFVHSLGHLACILKHSAGDPGVLGVLSWIFNNRIGSMYFMVAHGLEI